MEDIRGIFRDIFNIYKKHEDKIDWNQWSSDILYVGTKYKDSLVCGEILESINRYMERRENESKENRE